MDKSSLDKLRKGGAKVAVSFEKLDAEDRKLLQAIVQSQNAMQERNEQMFGRIVDMMVEAIAHLSSRQPVVNVEPSNVSVVTKPSRVTHLSVKRDADGNISAITPTYSDKP